MKKQRSQWNATFVIFLSCDFSQTAAKISFFLAFIGKALKNFEDLRNKKVIVNFYSYYISS